MKAYDVRNDVACLSAEGRRRFQQLIEFFDAVDAPGLDAMGFDPGARGPGRKLGTIQSPVLQSLELSFTQLGRPAAGQIDGAVREINGKCDHAGNEIEEQPDAVQDGDGGIDSSADLTLALRMQDGAAGDEGERNETDEGEPSDCRKHVDSKRVR